MKNLIDKSEITTISKTNKDNNKPDDSLNEFILVLDMATNYIIYLGHWNQYNNKRNYSTFTTFKSSYNTKSTV